MMKRNAVKIAYKFVIENVTGFFPLTLSVLRFITNTEKHAS